MAVRFLLNGALRAVEVADPTTTLLDWLREDATLRGTKEGCAEGDCGACTVLVGELEGEAIGWRPLNACILFLPMLDGRAVVTVEGLRGPDGALHPAQAALVEHHGSQCGFCTPGFVMTLAWLRQERRLPLDHTTVTDALAGNLCRCTGYRPIVDAALAMAEGRDVPDRIEREAPAWALELRKLAREVPLTIDQNGRRWRSPCSATGVADALGDDPDATVLAGATDVGLWVTKQQRALRSIVWLGAAPDLARIETLPDGSLVIGAAVRLADAHAALVRDWPELDLLFRRYGGPQVRSAGTLVGNLANASPIGDGSPALLALGAVLRIRDRKGVTELPLERFFLGYRRTALGERRLIEAVRVPPRAPGTTLRAWKVSKRRDQDISAVCLVLQLVEAAGRVVSARLAFGGMAAVPARAAAAEAALLGRPLDGTAIERACAALARDFQPIDDHRASAAYRLEVARNLLRRLHHERSGIAVDLAALAPVLPLHA